jgi:NADPH-dependent glutamate synthase beta subunit-like oxidoreductase
MRSPFTQERQDEIKVIQPESVEAFLVRGGKITGKTTKTKKTTKIDAQQLLDAAIGTENEAAVIAFLASQGIEVQ